MIIQNHTALFTEDINFLFTRLERHIAHWTVKFRYEKAKFVVLEFRTVASLTEGGDRVSISKKQTWSGGEIVLIELAPEWNFWDPVEAVARSQDETLKMPLALMGKMVMDYLICRLGQHKIEHIMEVNYPVDTFLDNVVYSTHLRIRS